MKMTNFLLRYFGLVLFKRRDWFHYVPDIYGRSSRKLKDIREDEFFKAKADRAMKDQRTLLYYDRLYTLYQAFLNAQKTAGERMAILEAGVYRGGSSFFLASLATELKNKSVKIFAVDTFEGHAAQDLPTGKEGKDHVPGLFNTDFADVSRYLSVFPFVSVIKGRIQDVAHTFNQERFSLCHLDMDIYEPTRFALEFLGTRMAPGGIIVLDDYGFRTCPGVQKAVDEFCEKQSAFVKFALPSGQCVLVMCGDITP